MRKATSILIVLFWIGVFSSGGLAPGEARAHGLVAYHGAHPIPEAFGGGFCFEEGLHYHDYTPVYAEYYVIHDSYYAFIGDPWLFGYEGDLHWYYGPHPVYTPWGVEICYIEGPHRHWFVPRVNLGAWYFTGGYYYYYGSWPRHYRPHYRVHPARHFSRRYAHYQRIAPRTRPSGRPPAVHRLDARRRDGRVRDGHSHVTRPPARGPGGRPASRPGYRAPRDPRSGGESRPAARPAPRQGIERPAPPAPGRRESPALQPPSSRPRGPERPSVHERPSLPSRRPALQPSSSDRRRPQAPAQRMRQSGGGARRPAVRGPGTPGPRPGSPPAQPPRRRR